MVKLNASNRPLDLVEYLHEGFVRNANCRVFVFVGFLEEATRSGISLCRLSPRPHHLLPWRTIPARSLFRAAKKGPQSVGVEVLAFLF